MYVKTFSLVCPFSLPPLCLGVGVNYWEMGWMDGWIDG